MRPNPSFAKMYREFGDRWDIEPIPPGTKWVAVDRESCGDLTRLVFAHEVGALRYRMTEAEKEEPEEPESGTSPARPPSAPTAEAASVAR